MMENEFKMGEVFVGKVVGIVEFNGRLFVAREDGLFVKGEQDDIFRRVPFLTDSDGHVQVVSPFAKSDG